MSWHLSFGRHSTFWYVSAPIITNSVLAATGFRFPDGFEGDMWVSYGVGFIAAACGLWSVAAFFTKDIGPKRAILALTLQGMAIILVFAAVYRGYGLVNAPRIMEWYEAIYFSIVTWTTLGYGDLSPRNGLQLLAAFQAGLGYVFLGLIVGMLVNLLSRLDAERPRT